MNPAHPAALLHYARIRMASFDFKTAHICLRSLEENGKQSPGFVRAYALCLHRVGKLPAAYSYYRRVEKPDMGVLLEHASLCHTLGKYKEALTLTQQALSLIDEPIHKAQVENNIGELYSLLSLPDKAKTSFESALNAPSETPRGEAVRLTAMYNLGCVL